MSRSGIPVYRGAVCAYTRGIVQAYTAPCYTFLPWSGMLVYRCVYRRIPRSRTPVSRWPEIFTQVKFLLPLFCTSSVSLRTHPYLTPACLSSSFL